MLNTVGKARRARKEVKSKMLKVRGRSQKKHDHSIISFSLFTSYFLLFTRGFYVYGPW